MHVSLCITQLGGSFKVGEGREQEVRDMHQSIEAQIILSSQQHN